MIKEFESRGLPWLYDGKEEPEVSEYATRPEPSDEKVEKRERVEEIMRRLEQNDQEVYEYRREMINNRKYGGFGRVAVEFFPSWITYLKRGGAENQTKMSKKARDRAMFADLD